ncbi:MAG: L-histidine N(alpha)-methyltransferase [Acidobacteriia bacterium]|nr:L-histidine N(alpha)-methyltransferase [Terriglobia bacterium]
MRATSTEPQQLSSIAADVLAGLSATPKTLPPKLFYDAAGSELFEQITRLPEYYLTRRETSILRGQAKAMVMAAGLPANVIELGAGTAIKTRMILEALQAQRGRVNFYPVDVSEAALDAAKENLRGLPEVAVHPLFADYASSMDFVGEIPGPRLILYLGSSIGNFEPLHASLLLSHLRSMLGARDTLLLGTDMAKDASVLLTAYDDAAGVTAAFNRNVLVRINRELGANFEPESFAHVARWNEMASRIEMHLESGRAQEVEIRGLQMRVRFQRGETIHTENSYKFTPTMVESILRNGRFVRECTWMDSRQWFALHLARTSS